VKIFIEQDEEKALEYLKLQSYEHQKTNNIHTSSIFFLLDYFCYACNKLP